MDHRSELLSPTSFRERTGGIRKRHEGHLYVLQVTKPSGNRYYACVHHRTGCPGRLKATASGTEVTRAHTCLHRPIDGGTATRAPASAATGVVRKRLHGYLYELTAQEARGVRHYRCARYAEGCPGRLRTSSKSTAITQEHTCRPRAGATADPHHDLVSPDTFRADTGGIRKRHGGYLYHLKSTSAIGTRYYRCVQPPCTGGLKSTAAGSVVTRQHTCRPPAGVSGRRGIEQQVHSRQADARPATTINSRSTFQTVQQLSPPLSTQSEDDDFSNVDDMVVDDDHEDEGDDGEDYVEEEDTNDPFYQLQIDYIKQKMEIGELTKQKLRIEIQYLTSTLRPSRDQAADSRPDHDVLIVR